MTTLISARPTAVNITNAAHALYRLVDDGGDVESYGFPCFFYSASKQNNFSIILACESMLVVDQRTNRQLAAFGADAILNRIDGARGARVITYCNTGSLATAGYGTALGVIRQLTERRRLEHVFACETRPYLQVWHIIRHLHRRAGFTSDHVRVGARGDAVHTHRRQHGRRPNENTVDRRGRRG